MFLLFDIYPNNKIIITIVAPFSDFINNLSVTKNTARSASCFLLVIQLILLFEGKSKINLSFS